MNSDDEISDDEIINVGNTTPPKPQINEPLKKVPPQDKALRQRTAINEALKKNLPHHQELVKDNNPHITGWIYKTNAPEDKFFFEVLDEAVFYRNGILLTRGEKCLDGGSKLFWGSVFGGAAGGIIPVAFVAGGDIFGFWPIGSKLAFLPMGALLPSLFHQGVEFADSIKQFVYPQGLTSKIPHPEKLRVIQLDEAEKLLDGAMIKTRIKDANTPHVHSYEDLNFHRVISFGLSLLEEWKFIYFFYDIEKYTYKTRLWSSGFIIPYSMWKIYTAYSYLMDYFKKRNAQKKNEAFVDKTTLKMKKILQDQLRKTTHFVNGNDSDELVHALYEILEERKNKIGLSISIRDIMFMYNSSEIKHDVKKLEERNNLLHEIILKYIKKAVPTLSRKLQSALENNIRDIVKEIFSLYVEQASDSEINSSILKIQSFIKKQVLYIKMHLVLEKTLSNKNPKWNVTLEKAVYELLNQTSAPSKSKEMKLRQHMGSLKGIIEGDHVEKMRFFISNLARNLLLQEIDPRSEDLTESGMSSLFPLPVGLFFSQDQEDPILKIERNLIKDLNSTSSKSTIKRTLEDTSKCFLSMHSLLRFICSLWAFETVLQMAGQDPTTAFYGGICLAMLDSVVGMIKNWYPQQQEFADLRRMGSKHTNFRCLRGVSKIPFAILPAAFTALATAGIVWTKLENITASWLIYVILTRGMPTELMSQFNFFGKHVDKIITSLVTWIPIPEWAPDSLKIAQERAIVNKAIEDTGSLIMEIDEPTTKRFYEALPKDQQEED